MNTKQETAKTTLCDNQFQVVTIFNCLPSDIFEVNAKIYWIDFLSCLLTGWGAFITLGIVPLLSLQFWVLFLISIFAFYRGLGFVHEICHQSNNKKFMRNFIFVWHFSLGIFFFFPTTAYSCHLDHHNPKYFKSDRDPQYPIVKDNPLAIFLLLVIQPMIYPVLLAIRYLILAPMSFVHQPLRHFLESHFSSITYLGYVAKFNDDQKKFLLKIEISMFLTWFVLILLFSFQILPILYLSFYYFISVVIWSLNFFRALGEHRLDELSDRALTLEEQFLDSFNYSQGVFLPLLYATGLRYHALHHLFPAIPYHNLSNAHNYLKEYLPKDSFYHQAEAVGHWYNFRQLWKKSDAIASGVKTSV
jgi:fatty acid desaturase